MAITFLDSLITSGDLTVSGGDIVLGGTGRIQGVDTVSANTDAANKLYVDNAIAGVPQGDITGVTAGTGMTGGGTSGTVVLNVIGGTGITANANDIEIDSTVLTTTGSQTITGAKRFNGSILDAGGSSGTPGQVLASTVATRVAFGAASSTTEITSDPGLTYSSQNGLSVGDTTGSGNSAISMDKGSAGQGRFIMKESGTEKFSIKLDISEESYITAANKLTIATTGTTRDILIDSTGNVGIGDSTPSSTLSVDGGVQIGDDQATGVALANKVGTFRYHTDNPAGIFDYSYVDMCMQTDTATYEWVNIVTNRWER
jgi:hypothetical protein